MFMFCCLKSPEWYTLWSSKAELLCDVQNWKKRKNWILQFLVLAVLDNSRHHRVILAFLDERVYHWDDFKEKTCKNVYIWIFGGFFSFLDYNGKPYKIKMPQKGVKNKFLWKIDPP